MLRVTPATMVIAMWTELLKEKKKEEGEFPMRLSHSRSLTVLIPRRRNRDYESYLQLVKLLPSLKDRATGLHTGLRLMYYTHVS